jgi:hypothetical protein
VDPRRHELECRAERTVTEGDVADADAAGTARQDLLVQTGQARRAPADQPGIKRYPAIIAASDRD